MSESPDRPLFLPITASRAELFFVEQELPGLPVERAALMAIYMQLDKPMSQIALEQLVATAEWQFAQDPESGARYLERLRGAATVTAPREILAGLAKSGVTYAPVEMMSAGAWANADGRYDFGFQLACRTQMDDWDLRFEKSDPRHAGVVDEGEDATPAERIAVRLHGMRDQVVAAQVIAAGIDEHVAVNAYAGTGKTHLVHTLAASLRDGVTYLAPSKAHLFGFEAGAGADVTHVRRVTLWELAHTMSTAHARRLKKSHVLRCGTSLLSQMQQASLVGIEAIGEANRGLVFWRANAIVAAWCRSDAPVIAARHASRVVPAGEDIPRHLAAAERLWQAMITIPPKGGHAFDITLNHLTKWLLLSGARIPASYGLLLVDEAHDLLPAWRHLLQTYEGGCVMLGDPNQHLRGNPFPVTGMKDVTMSQSVRLGLGAEGLVQRTLAMDTTALMTAEFSGSRDHITRQRQFERRTDVPVSGLRVYGSEWALLDDALALREAGASFRLLPASLGQLQRLALEAIAMRGGGAFHGVRYNTHKTWNALAQSLQEQGLHTMLARFERGLSQQNLTGLQQAQAADDAGGLILGLIDHAKNLEADHVTLMDCCFDARSGWRNYMPSRAAYLAITRARHEVWMPGDAMERLAILQRAG